FKEHYPFSLDAGERTLYAKDEFTHMQEAYIFILLCANLPFIPKRGLITDYFEKISLNALSSIWPQAGEARTFGKNTSDFSGTKSERINALAEFIGAEGKCNGDMFRQGDSGDGGIDLA